MAKRKSRCTRWVAAFDTHGDQIDKDAEEAFFSFVKDYKPDLRIHGGDFCDMRALRKGATPEEKADGITDDIGEARRFLHRYKPNALLFGNHDERLSHSAKYDANGAIRYAASQVLDGLYELLDGVNILPYDKFKGVYKLGDLNIIHGYGHGMYVAKQAAAAFCGNTLMGHVHSASMIPVGNIDGHMGYTSGCLCNLNMDYVKAKQGTFRWDNGWAFGVVDSQGRTTVNLHVHTSHYRGQ